MKQKLTQPHKMESIQPRRSSRLSSDRDSVASARRVFASAFENNDEEDDYQRLSFDPIYDRRETGVYSIMEENEDDKSLISVASNQENIKPTATTSPNVLRQSTESIKRTPRKIFTALSQPSPQPSAPLSSRETMSSISMSVLNEAINSPSKSKSSKSQSLKANLTTTLESVSASKQSINLALNNVRAAKKQAQERRRIATQRLKEEREQEKAENIAFNREKERVRLEILKERGNVGMDMAKFKAKQRADQKQKKFKAAVDEGEFKRERDREGKKLLKEDVDRRRRFSVMKRRDVRQNNVEGEERLRQIRAAEDQALIEERREGVMATAAYKKKLAEDRRKSMAGRNQAWSEQKNLLEEQRHEQLEEDHESYELSAAGMRDADAYKRKLAEDRRKSFQGRNDATSRAAKWAEEARQHQLQEEHESYELAWAGQDDAAAYKKFLAKQEAADFAKRNEDGFDAKARLEQQRHEQLAADHESYELTAAGMRDADAYKKFLAKQESQDYAKRGEDAFDAKTHLEQQRHEQLAADHESYELTAAGMRDADAYKKFLAKQEQMDYAKRNEDGFDAKIRLEQQRHEQLAADHESYELTAVGMRDADAYKKFLAKQEAADYAKRNEDGFDAKTRLEQQRHEQLAMDHESYELKAAGMRDADAYKKFLAKQEQLDFAKRNEDGFDAKTRLEQQRHEQLAADHESYELTAAGMRDADAYKKQMAEEEAADYAKKNEDGFDAKTRLEQQRHEQLAMDHESYELTAAGMRDADAYKKQMAEDERQDYENRNLEGFAQKRLLEDQRQDQLHAEHESFELKWQGQDDAKAYQQHLRDERRKSFAARNENHSQQRKIIAEIEEIAKEKEHESMLLKWSAQEDGKAYRKRCDEERRMSLVGRGEQSRHEQMIDEENKMNALNQQHYDSDLAAAAARDVKGYQKSCAARDRASSCFRAKESRIQRMEEESRIAKQREIDEENNELEAAARQDVKAYVKQCKARRRMSLATRAQEKRHAAEVQRFAAEEEAARFKKEVRNRQLDAKYAALAKERAQAMRALENLKHANCSFAALNPFAMLLD
ncbi:hypothetical protein TrLO_g14883 [Triparma laevis f. longispina]|uniref:Uncharacterized protein n=1 Tax=Triparma laevis f. longispina TaxID=1714387 RepID=A0A9W7L0X9_9STRA|nr:hypothetical protein TrLO_g14883 [Triparma laevis f. longispina]